MVSSIESLRRRRDEETEESARRKGRKDGGQGSKAHLPQRESSVQEDSSTVGDGDEGADGEGESGVDSSGILHGDEVEETGGDGS